MKLNVELNSMKHRQQIWLIYFVGIPILQIGRKNNSYSNA